MIDSSNSSRWPLRCLGLAAAPLYGCVALLAEGFRPEADTQPPLLTILILLGVACGIYLLALRLVARDPAASLSTVLFFSLAYRLILLPSWPIQEIDFYRYLWDGKVTLNGSNPYRYSPTQIEEAEFREAAPADLTELRRLANETESVRTIFENVHYRDIPTAYPPVSQAVFALSIWLTPRDGSVWLHVMILKSVLLLFDLGTLLVVVGLLRTLGLPLGWGLAYGWCPLALKEFANTGHLDTIAVFFTTLAIYLLVSKDGLPRAALALGVLALGVLAKSYPIILLPLVGVYVARRFRLAAVVPLAVFVAVLVAGYLPFQRGEAPTRDANHPGSGVSTFLFTRWEMNDLLFALVYRNLAAPPQRGDPWFTLVPESTRAALNTRVLDSIGELGASARRRRPGLLACAGRHGHDSAADFAGANGAHRARAGTRDAAPRLLRGAGLGLAFEQHAESVVRPLGPAADAVRRSPRLVPDALPGPHLLSAILVVARESRRPRRRPGHLRPRHRLAGIRPPVRRAGHRTPRRAKPCDRRI